MKFQDMPYERIDFEKIKKQFDELEKELDEAKNGEEQFQVHEKYYQLSDHVMTEMTLCEIRHSIDVTDEFYNEQQAYYDKMRPLYQSMVVSYQKKLFDSPYRDVLEKKIGPVAFKNIALAQKTVEKQILPLMQEENALQTRYNNILASAKIPWGQSTLNLSLLEPYLRNKDRAVRKKAWEKYAGFFVEHQEELDDIYDRLVKNRTKQARKLGYENYLPLGYARMMRNCYDRKDIQNFREQIKRDLVPYAEKLHEKRRKRLGLDELRYYDEGVYFKEGNPVPDRGAQEILDAGLKMYRELSPETAEFMDFMCQNELFDVLGKKTKVTGGYMTYLPDYKAPFIFANFNGTSGDADVITHECGHAFQGYLAAADPIREHADITMETAETHSMSMEYFTEPWMHLFFGDRAKDYVDMHFEDSIVFLPYGTMVDEFQDICYSNPEMTPKERNAVWRDLEKQYKPHLNYEGNAYYEAGGFWQEKHHIYDSPLYYIDYCIAGTDALQYKAWMDRDYKKAWQSYLSLCRLSASGFFTELITKVGLQSPFEDGCLKKIVEALEKQK